MFHADVIKLSPPQVNVRPSNIKSIYDALGQEKAANYFADNQHTTKAGARLNAESVVEGIKQLKDCPLAKDLASASVAATPAP